MLKKKLRSPCKHIFPRHAKSGDLVPSMQIKIWQNGMFCLGIIYLILITPKLDYE